MRNSRLSILGLAAAMVIAVAPLSGCTHTKEAYASADTLDERAYVLTEHYAAAVKEAADIKQSGRASADAVKALQDIDTQLGAIVVGDPAASRPGVKQLAEKWAAVRDAKTEADLQKAVDDAVLLLADFLRAINKARGSTT